MKKFVFAAGAAVLAAAAASPAEARIRAGMLRCEVSPSVSYIIGSHKDLDCTYRSVSGYSERYSGRIVRLGLDIGYTRGGKLAWAVYAPARPGFGALAGPYLGASAEATVVGGVAANALVGGVDNSITLQPLSIGIQRGLDVALAASGLRLYSIP